MGARRTVAMLAALELPAEEKICAAERISGVSCSPDAPWPKEFPIRELTTDDMRRYGGYAGALAAQSLPVPAVVCCAQPTMESSVRF